VAKLDFTGSALLYSTYLGGSSAGAGFAIAVDSNDAAYIAGATPPSDFPVTAGTFQRVHGGESSPLPGLAGDAFVTKFTA
jgi:hypothetical protein